MTVETLSLRRTIDTLSSSSEYVPATPDFPYNEANDASNAPNIRMNVDRIIADTRGDVDLFDDVTSLKMNTQHFREFFPRLRRSMFDIRMVLLTPDFRPMPLFNAATDTSVRAHQVTEGNILVLSTFDRLTSSAKFYFLKVLATGAVLDKNQPTPFVNVRRILTIIDTPERTRLIKEDDVEITDDVQNRALSICWNLLTGFSSEDFQPSLEQHLYRRKEFDLKAFLEEKKDTARFVTENGAASKLLPFINFIFANRDKVLQKSGRDKAHLNLAITFTKTDVEDKPLRLEVVTLPTKGVNAPVATLVSEMNQTEFDYLKAAEPDLGDLEATPGVTYYFQTYYARTTSDNDRHK